MVKEGHCWAQSLVDCLPAVDGCRSELLWRKEHALAGEDSETADEVDNWPGHRNAICLFKVSGLLHALTKVMLIRAVSVIVRAENLGHSRVP